MRSSIALFSLLPLVSSLTLPRNTSANSWQISNIATHYMGANSGIASGSWPPGTAFNSTISFALSQDFANTAHESAPTDSGCSAQWVPGATGAQAYPTNWVECGDAGSGVSWRFENTTAMNQGYAGSFVIDVKMDGTVGSVKHEYAGNVNVTSNSGSGNSMTCLGGAPLTGIHCTGGPFTVPVTSDKVIS